MANDLTLSDDVRADLATMRALLDAVPVFMRKSLVARGAPEGIVDENFLRLLANRDPSRPFHAIRAGLPGAPFAIPDCTQGGASAVQLLVNETGDVHFACGHAPPHRWNLDGTAQA